MSKHIKKLNELFDSEDLYAKSEIDYLTGNTLDDIKSKLKNGEIDGFEDSPELVKLSKQLSLNFPFIKYSAAIALHRNEKGIAYVFTNGKEMIDGFVFSVECLENDKYDVIHGIFMEGEEYSKREESLDFDTMMNTITTIVYSNLKKAIEEFKENGINIIKSGEEISNFNPMFNSVIYSFDEYVNETK